MTLKFTPALAPDSVSGNIRLDVPKASGSLSNLTALAAIVDCDLTLDDIHKLSLRLEQSGVALAEVRASGPFSLAKSEGKIKVELGPIDRRALSIVGGPLHIDFNKTVIGSTNEIDISQKAKVFAVNGNFSINDFSATLTNGVTPTLNLVSTYVINADLTKSNATIQQFTVAGTQNRTPFLTAGLSKPMAVNWGDGAGAPEEASLDLLLTNFNLSDWAGFAGTLAPAGKADAALKLVSRSGGKELAVDLNAGLHDFGATFGSNKISKTGIQLALNTTVSDFKKVAIKNLKLDVTQNNAPAVAATLSGIVDAKTQDADLKAALEARIPELLKAVVVPGITFQSGAVRFDGRVVKTNNLQTVAGALVVTNLTGTASGASLDRFQANVDTDIAVNGSDLKINKLAAVLRQSGLPAGTVDVKGALNLSNKQGQIALQVADVNQNLLKPFIAAPGSSNKLDSISVNVKVNTTLGASNAIAVTGAVEVANLTGTIAGAALDRFQANVDTDVAINNGSDLKINKLAVALRQSGLPAGTVDVKGALNLTNKQGQIALQMTNVNQNLLKPFAASALSGKQLSSVTINAGLNTTLGVSNAVAVVGGLEITNLVVRATNDTAAPHTLERAIQSGRRDAGPEVRHPPISDRSLPDRQRQESDRP